MLPTPFTSSEGLYTLFCYNLRIFSSAHYSYIGMEDGKILQQFFWQDVVWADLLSTSLVGCPKLSIELLNWKSWFWAELVLFKVEKKPIKIIRAGQWEIKKDFIFLLTAALEGECIA